MLLFLLLVLGSEFFDSADPNFSLLAVNTSLDDNMIFVQGGTFMMGCDPKVSPRCFEQDTPLHRVTVSDFFLCKYEVTVAQFCHMINDYGLKNDDGKPFAFTKLSRLQVAVHNIVKKKGKYVPRKGFENHAFVDATWYGAVAYCEWLSEQTGNVYRLPTEAEWEFAAKGGIKSKGYRYAGSNTLDSVCTIFSGIYGEPLSHEVGLQKPNELGLYNMSGNASEWCSDWYAADYYQNSPVENPLGPEMGSLRIFRGRALRNSEKREGEVSLRLAIRPKFSSHTGIRVARSSNSDR